MIESHVFNNVLKNIWGPFDDDEKQVFMVKIVFLWMISFLKILESCDIAAPPPAYQHPVWTLLQVLVGHFWSTSLLMWLGGQGRMAQELGPLYHVGDM